MSTYSHHHGPRLIRTEWIAQDAWWRRDVGQESFLTVCRNENGLWHWRWSQVVEQLREGRLNAEAWGFNSAAAAKADADKVVARGLAPAPRVTIGPVVESVPRPRSRSRGATVGDLVATLHAFSGGAA